MELLDKRLFNKLINIYPLKASHLILQEGEVEQEEDVKMEKTRQKWQSQQIESLISAAIVAIKEQNQIDLIQI